MESFLWMKAKTFQRKVKFFPICLFCMCFKTSDLCSLMTDESSSRTRDHRLTYVSCSEGRERGRGGGRREQHAGFTGTTAHSERERDDRRRETHARLTSTISVLEYLVRVCSTGWMTEICTTVFSFRSQTGATRSLHAGNSRKRKKEKHLTRSLRANFCPELKQTLPTRRRKSPGPQLALQRKSLGSTLQK